MLMESVVENSNISKITDFLYISSKIRGEDWHVVEKIQPDLVISMIPGRGYSKLEFHESIEFLILPSFDSFLAPIPMHKLLRGVRMSLPIIKHNGKVLVYCMKGKRRSVTMAAAILIALGNTAEQAINLIKRRRKIADPTRWYVKRRIHSFEEIWNKTEVS